MYFGVLCSARTWTRKKHYDHGGVFEFRLLPTLVRLGDVLVWDLRTCFVAEKFWKENTDDLHDDDDESDNISDGDGGTIVTTTNTNNSEFYEQCSSDRLHDVATVSEHFADAKIAK